MMTFRVVRNATPMDARYNNLAYELRRLGYDPALVGYTTTTRDPRELAENDPRLQALGNLMPGWNPISAARSRPPALLRLAAATWRPIA